MHHTYLPDNAEVEFISALAHGANGELYRLVTLSNMRQVPNSSLCTERVSDYNKDTTFPFTDVQAQRLMQIHQSLRCEYHVARFPGLPLNLCL